MPCLNLCGIVRLHDSRSIPGFDICHDRIVVTRRIQLREGIRSRHGIYRDVTVTVVCHLDLYGDAVISVFLYILLFRRAHSQSRHVSLFIAEQYRITAVRIHRRCRHGAAVLHIVRELCGCDLTVCRIRICRKDSICLILPVIAQRMSQSHQQLTAVASLYTGLVGRGRSIDVVLKRRTVGGRRSTRSADIVLICSCIRGHGLRRLRLPEIADEILHLLIRLLLQILRGNRSQRAVFRFVLQRGGQDHAAGIAAVNGQNQLAGQFAHMLLQLLGANAVVRAEAQLGIAVIVIVAVTAVGNEVQRAAVLCGVIDPLPDALPVAVILCRLGHLQDGNAVCIELLRTQKGLHERLCILLGAVLQGFILRLGDDQRPPLRGRFILFISGLCCQRNAGLAKP